MQVGLLPALACLLPLLGAAGATSARETLQVYVTAPYLELHTGPGRGYPVFHVAARGEAVEVLKRRTEWFKVRTTRGVEGWARQEEMLTTALEDGSPLTFNLGDRAGYNAHRVEVGLFTGDYERSDLVSAYAAWSFNPQLAAELSVSHFMGNASNGVAAHLGLAHVFVPEWRLTPFVMLGTGIVHIEPKPTLVQPPDRTDQSAYVGAGARFYLTRRFFVRGEYKNHVIFTSRDDNEEVDEWKLGFAFFF